MKFKKILSMALAFSLCFAPVAASAAEISDEAEPKEEEEIVLEDVADESADTVEMNDEEELSYDSDDKTLWLHNASWEKTPGSETTAVLGKKTTLEYLLKDVVTLFDPSTPYEAAPGRYTSPSKDKIYSWDFMITGPDGFEDFKDPTQSGPEFSYEFTPAKTGKYKAQVFVRPGLQEEHFLDGEITATTIITVSDKEPTTPVTSVKLDMTSAEIAKGKTLQLNATVLPADATDKSLEWKSSKESVATVDKNGKVTAKGTGTCDITATAKDGSGKKATCKIKVGKAVTKIEVTSSKKSILIGKSVTLKVKVTPSDAVTTAVTWKSSDEKIATVNKNGKVTGIKKGKVKITAKAKDGSGVKGSIEINVLKPVSKVELDRSVLYLKPNANKTVSVKVKPSSASNRKLKWTSSNNRIATVGKDGKIKAIKVGKCKITAEATDGSKKKDTLQLYVGSMKLNKDEVTVKKDRSYASVKVTLKYDEVKKIKIDNEKIVSAYYNEANDKIEIYGKKKGNTKITVTSEAGNKKTIKVHCEGKTKTGSKIK